METLSSYQSHQASYQRFPYPPEPRNNISPGPNFTNETGYTNALSSDRFNHSPAGGRFPRNDEFQAARPRSRLQTRTCPPAAAGIASGSPALQNAVSSRSLSAFPLPFRPRSVTHHLSPKVEYSSPAFPLASQDVRHCHSPSFKGSQGRLFGFNDDPHAATGSASLPDSQSSGSNMDIEYSRDTKWPQSRTQSRRKYPSKGRRYDSAVNQRRLDRGHLNSRPPRKPPLFSNQVKDKRAQNNQREKLSGLLYDEDTPNISYQVSQRPRLARCPLPSNPLDDDSSIFNKMDSTCVSQYASPGNADNSAQPIRESEYWVQMQDDPIFSDLSTQNKFISIEELVKRRARTLQNHVHVHVSHQTIMKEQCTQTDIESSALLHQKHPSNTARGKDGLALDSNKIKREQTTPPLPPQFQHQSSPREKPHGKQGNSHSRTTSLTDPDISRSHTPQHTRMNGLKRSRSDTEDDYKRDSYHRRRRSDIDSTPLSSPSRFSQRARTSFYRRL